MSRISDLKVATFAVERQHDALSRVAVLAEAYLKAEHSPPTEKLDAHDQLCAAIDHLKAVSI